MSQAKIELFFEGLNPDEVEQFRDIINHMFEASAFKVRNGKVILHFDHLGVLQEIGVDHKRWRRKKLT